MKQSINPGSFGYDLNDDQSPLYVVHSVTRDSLKISQNFDDPPSEQLTINLSDFWCIA